MVRTTTFDYEVSSESGRERHVRIPYARCTVNPPVLHDPVQVLGVILGTQLTGTVINVLPVADALAIINTASGAVYWHNVRNVLTYNAGAENTFGPINVGDPIYYDRSNTMPANTFLSTSPLDRVAAANTLFGYAVMGRQETAASFPKGGIVASTQEVAVEQK